MKKPVLKFKMTKTLLVLICAFLVAALVGFVIAVVKYVNVDAPRKSSSVTVSLFYENASAGLDPNGRGFHAESLLTDGVIKTALESCGMEDRYNVQQIRKCLSISGSYPRNLLKLVTSFDSLVDTSFSRLMTQSNYYPSQYTIKLYGAFDQKISKADLNKLLKAISDSYVAAFLSTYDVIFDTSSLTSIMPLETHDYEYQLDILEYRLRRLASYASSLYNRHPDFSVSGRSFNDITLKSNSVISKDISTLNSNITLNVLSKDTETLKSYLSYRIRMANLELTLKTSDYNSITGVITNFDKDSTMYITSGDQVIKVDGTSSETYDSLVRRQLELSEAIATLNKNISDYTERLDYINQTGKSMEYAAIEADLNSITSTVSGLSEEFSNMLARYNERYINESIIPVSDVKYASASIFSTGFIVECVKCCGPLCMLVVLAGLGIWVWNGIIEDKKRRAAEAQA